MIVYENSIIIFYFLGYVFNLTIFGWFCIVYFVQMLEAAIEHTELYYNRLYVFGKIRQ